MPPQIFQTMNSVRSNDISLKYKRFTTLDSKDKGIIKSEFVTQFLFSFPKYLYSEECEFRLESKLQML